MSNAKPVRVERDGPLASIVLDSPPLNLFGKPMVEALQAAVSEVEASDARALMLRAEGEVFTGGADVNEFAGLSDEQGLEFMRQGIELVSRVEALPIPTLSVAHALCLTAGFELSLGCDLIWAAEDANFGLVEAVVGLTPGWGGNQRLVERAGPARAKELIFNGGLFGAGQLEQWNVVNRVLATDELLPAATRFARRLANGPTKAHAATKQIVRAVRSGGVNEADRRTPAIVGELFETADLQDAVQSFLDVGPGNARFQGK